MGRATRRQDGAVRPAGLGEPRGSEQLPPPAAREGVRPAPATDLEVLGAEPAVALDGRVGGPGHGGEADRARRSTGDRSTASGTPRSGGRIHLLRFLRLSQRCWAQGAGAGSPMCSAHPQIHCWAAGEEARRNPSSVVLCGRALLHAPQVARYYKELLRRRVVSVPRSLSGACPRFELAARSPQFRCVAPAGGIHPAIHPAPQRHRRQQRSSWPRLADGALAHAPPRARSTFPGARCPNNIILGTRLPM